MKAKEKEHSEICRVMRNLYPETWHKKREEQKTVKWWHPLKGWIDIKEMEEQKTK